MTDQAPTSTPAPAPTPAPPETPAPADATDWKAEARKWEERSKANKADLDKLATERDELAGKVTEHEATKQRDALLAEIASTHKVPVAALRGGTREELEAHATVLSEHFKPSGPIIPGQEKAPNDIPETPEKKLVRELFGSSK